MDVLTLHAPAKLNLYLHITGKRPDGYHLMESLVVFTELADVLRIEACDALSLSVDGEFAHASGNQADNLVIKAARALQAHAGVKHGAKLHLTKRIPVGAGLGGGSADAAAALRGLNQLWQLQRNMIELQAIAATIGADVPMCVVGESAIARGIGDQLELLPYALPVFYALLVHPNVPLLTKDVYAAFAHRTATHGDPWQPAPYDAASFIASLLGTRNHLQPAAIGVNPLVAEVLLALDTVSPAADLVRLTGSGACCFALYRHREEAQSAKRRLTRDYPDWFVALTATQP
ncbi:MAG: 4-(cytidine 5'-diphospho)-2-C-methyl-D-erythritol kinase [Rickettsiales bacterium]|nr:4-(cytidine 5'-diphospho)-2-C-methyl-D-erythritol kinase [Rickettsiales bacterium]